MSYSTTLDAAARSAAVSALPVDPYAVMAARTWRYLRIAMVTLPVGLGVATWWEYTRIRAANGGQCLQESISAYY